MSKYFIHKNKYIKITVVFAFFLLITPFVNAAGSYRTHSEMITLFKNLCDAHTSKTSYEIIGKTTNGNDIWTFKVGNPNGGRILIDGCLHGWEDMGSEIVYLWIRWLLESNDSKANQILTQNYWIITPVVNYDSYTRDNSNISLCSNGVDLNRNFPVNWTYVADCGGNYSDSYGAYGGSEKEVQVMMNLMNRYKPTGSNKALFVNTHYGGGPYIHYVGYNFSFYQSLYSKIRSLWTQNNIIIKNVAMKDFLPVGLTQPVAGGGEVREATTYGYDSFVIEMCNRNAASRYAPADGDNPDSQNPPYSLITDQLFPIYKQVFIAMSNITVSTTQSSPITIQPDSSQSPIRKYFTTQKIIWTFDDYYFHANYYPPHKGFGGLSAQIISYGGYVGINCVFIPHWIEDYYNREVRNYSVIPEFSKYTWKFDQTNNDRNLAFLTSSNIEFESHGWNHSENLNDATLEYAYKIINYTLWNWYNNFGIQPHMWLGHHTYGNYNISLALKKFSEKYWTVYAEDFNVDTKYWYPSGAEPPVPYIGQFFDPCFGCDFGHPCQTIQEAQQLFAAFSQGKEIVPIRGHPYFLNGTDSNAVTSLALWQQFIDWVYEEHTYINIKHTEAIEYKVDRDNFAVEKDGEVYTIDLTDCEFDHKILFTNPDGNNERTWTLYDENGDYVGDVRNDIFLELKRGVKYYLNTTPITPTENKLYERFEPTEDNEFNIYGPRWKSETFTVGYSGANEKHTITNVELYLGRNGIPVGSFDVSIRATSGGVPIGSDITFGSIPCSSITSTRWYKITFNTPCILSTGTQYAIIARATSCTSTVNDICWATLKAGGYSGGKKYDSTTSGSSWTGVSAEDFLFREYGIQYTMRYTLLISKVGNGVVTPTSGVTYPAGTIVSIKAQPDVDWLFDHWDGDLTGSNNPTIITMNGNRTVLANFTHSLPPNNPPNIPTAPVPADGITNVSITTQLGWTGGDPDNDMVTYDVYFRTSISPTIKVSSNQSGTTFNPGVLAYGTGYYWRVVVWDSRGAQIAGPQWSFTTQNENVYTLTLTIQGNGTVQKNPDQATYHYNNIVQLTALPNLGWRFDHWSGDLSGSTSPVSVTMNGNKNMIANFSITTGYKLVVTIQGSGTVMKIPDQASYTYGQVVQLTANPTADWVFNHWAGDLAGSTNPANITMNANRTVLANFTHSLPPNNPPNIPTAPVPADGITNVSITTQLGWTGGDPDNDVVTYDVYFRTSISPTIKVSSNQSGTTFNPGVLAYSTGYYWRVVVWDSRGAQIAGPQWSFTTISLNHPPKTLRNPSPANSAKHVSINAGLRWTGGDPDIIDIVKYDVYFGTTNPPTIKVSSNQSATIYDPGTLLSNTRYYWRIVAWDNHGASTIGSIWKFTT